MWACLSVHVHVGASFNFYVCVVISLVAQQLIVVEVIYWPHGSKQINISWYSHMTKMAVKMATHTYIIGKGLKQKCLLAYLYEAIISSRDANRWGSSWSSYLYCSGSLEPETLCSRSSLGSGSWRLKFSPIFWNQSWLALLYLIYWSCLRLPLSIYRRTLQDKLVPSSMPLLRSLYIMNGVRRQQWSQKKPVAKIITVVWFVTEQ